VTSHPDKGRLPLGTWHDPDLGRPIAAPLERCAELLGVDLAAVTEVAGGVEPYIRADGTRIWSRATERGEMAGVPAAVNGRWCNDRWAGGALLGEFPSRGRGADALPVGRRPRCGADP
jgi:hypothetical protein